MQTYVSNCAQMNNGFKIYQKFTTGCWRHIRSDGPLKDLIYLYAPKWTMNNEFSNVSFVKKMKSFKQMQ